MTAKRDAERTTHEPGESSVGDRGAAEATALALLWSRHQPERAGEVVCLPRGAEDVAFTVGRADEPGPDGAIPLVFERLRPHERAVAGPLRDPRVSRWHLRVRPRPGGSLEVERIGRGELRVDGRAVDRAVAPRGALVEAVDLFTLLVTARPADWPRAPRSGPAFTFGAADPDGLVGESPAAWRLRRDLGLVAPRGEHVLVHGPGGAGKELAVRALHAGSPVRDGPRVARNAATMSTPTLAVELFGSAGPSAGPGLLGEADGGSLLLDFIDELPATPTAQLLRAMDTGEYQPVGAASPRRSRARWFGTTTRDPAGLPHALQTRFLHHVRVPGLDERREDVPLLARDFLRRRVDDPDLRARLFAGDEPRLAAGLVAALVRHPYTSHVRELHALLWRAIQASHGDTLEAAAEPHAPEPEGPAAAPTREQVVAALAACGGVREQAWRALGLRSRDQLKRLLKKYAVQ